MFLASSNVSKPQENLPLPPTHPPVFLQVIRPLSPHLSFGKPRGKVMKGWSVGGMLKEQVIACPKVFINTFVKLGSVQKMLCQKHIFVTEWLHGAVKKCSLAFTARPVLMLLAASVTKPSKA
jgi:hypothetical protein